ncbi:MAG TPA: hypothetical protein VH437_17725 [Terriglobales bacterium]
MADPLYLSLWFSSFDTEDILPRVLAVMQQFPFSSVQPGVTYVAMHPVSWNEATVLEDRFRPGIPPVEAVNFAADLLHEDYAYVFEAYWDLWNLSEETKDWVLVPSLVKFIARGIEFDEGSFEEEGHIQIDFGMDSAFIQEQLTLTSAAEAKLRANVQKLVDFTTRLDQNAGAKARLLWSESEENLAQKLISRLQKVQ